MVIVVVDRDQRQQWREERRGRGRGDRRGGWIRGSWREEERRKQPPTGEEENEGEEEDAERDSRLLNSLMDPQDVPRKGFFFEVLMNPDIHTTIQIVHMNLEFLVFVAAR